MYLSNLSSSTHTEIDDYCDSEWHAPAFEAYDTLYKETPAADDIKSLVTIEADSNLSLSDVHELLDEYSDIFSETLKAEPALVPPLELTVDKQMWEQPKHHSAPRAQTSANQAEIKVQLDKLVAQNIVRPSEAPYYSQVHLAEKPPKGSGKKRFCIDYVLLNQCTTVADHWPLPNIQQMLHRIADQTPKYFATFDLTAGYHQTPVSLSSIVFTAFICFCGLYEYLRVPFGLK